MSKQVGVACIAAFRDGKLLMGKRRDDGKWCCPGGHMEPGEEPLTAARRELHEETGMGAVRLRPLATKEVKKGAIKVHAFRAEVDGEPTNDNDPDAEFSEFRWLNPQKMPLDVMRNLHNDPDVILDALETGDERPWAMLGEVA